MSNDTLDITCSCGATMHYVGSYSSGPRDNFLYAHEPCRKAGVTASVQIAHIDPVAIRTSPLKLKRRNGGRSLGLS